MPDAMPSRTRRELHTVERMILLHCRQRHAAVEVPCADCADLLGYARRRVELCPYGAEKPVCNACPIHCYKPDRREQIRQVMRFAGPRMIWRHPWLALRHLWDSRRPAPPCPTRPSPSAETTAPGSP